MAQTYEYCAHVIDGRAIEVIFAKELVHTVDGVRRCRLDRSTCRWPPRHDTVLYIRAYHILDVLGTVRIPPNIIQIFQLNKYPDQRTHK